MTLATLVRNLGLNSVPHCFRARTGYRARLWPSGVRFYGKLRTEIP